MRFQESSERSFRGFQRRLRHFRWISEAFSGVLGSVTGPHVSDELQGGFMGSGAFVEVDCREKDYWGRFRGLHFMRTS